MNAKQRRKRRRETVAWLQLRGMTKPFRLTREVYEASRAKPGDFMSIDPLPPDPARLPRLRYEQT